MYGTATCSPAAGPNSVDSPPRPDATASCRVLHPGRPGGRVRLRGRVGVHPHPMPLKPGLLVALHAGVLVPPHSGERCSGVATTSTPLDGRGHCTDNCLGQRMLTALGAVAHIAIERHGLASVC